MELVFISHFCSSFSLYMFATRALPGSKEVNSKLNDTEDLIIFLTKAHDRVLQLCKWSAAETTTESEKILWRTIFQLGIFQQCPFLPQWQEYSAELHYFDTPLLLFFMVTNVSRPCCLWEKKCKAKCVQHYGHGSKLVHSVQSVGWLRMSGSSVQNITFWVQLSCTKKKIATTCLMWR